MFGWLLFQQLLGMGGGTGVVSVPPTVYQTLIAYNGNLTLTAYNGNLTLTAYN